jgi:hypothetical protein
MKRIFFYSVISMMMLGSPTSETAELDFPMETSPETETPKMELRINENGRIDSRDELIAAIIHIESTGNPDAVGDTHLDLPSIGCMQIRPIMVREVNRILKKSGSEKRFKLKDRKDRDKSIEMFNIWADAYHKDSSFEKMARNWNGGPKGYKKPSTEEYWAKVNAYAEANL